MRDSLNATQFRETLLVSFFLAVLLSLDTRAKGDDEDEALYSIPPRTLERRRLSSLLSLSLSFSLVLFYSFLFSSDVVIHVPVVLVSFHVLSIDQTFDSFFQVVIVRRELSFATTSLTNSECGNFS